MEPLGFDSETGRRLYHVEVEDSSEFSAELLPKGEPFVCLLAWDAAGLSVDEINSVVEPLLRAGCVYFCAWGSDCERVHDICDETIVWWEIQGQLSEDDDQLIMTTWHDDEPLQHALWFFLSCTLPADAFSAKCDRGIVLTIGLKPEHTDRVRAVLSDPKVAE